jgi:DNA topoisomerase-6 subunit B
VSSSADAKTSHEYEMMLDIQKNKPIIRKHSTKDTNRKGLSVSITLEGDYSKAGAKIRDYVYQTSLITPYATITFDDPKGERFQYKRIVDTMPPPPTIIRPHPHGVDVETLRRMIVDTHYQIPALDNVMIEKVRKELGLAKKNLNFEGIMAKAEKKWNSLSRPVRVIVALMSFLKMDFEKVMKIRIDDVDLLHKHLTYWDYGESKSITIDMPKSSPYYKQLANTVSGETLVTFLTKRFQRIGQATAIKFSEFSGLKAEKRIGSFSNEELVQLSDSLQRYEDFLTPDPSCLAPLGEEPLRKGIEQFFKPDFYDVVQRSASAYSGFPFVIEMGIAYGGQIPAGKIMTYRFANRIPLLYDEGSDVVLQVVNETDWGRYKIKNDSPLVIVSHICSTRIPYKTVGKENVADRPEIEKELRLALQFLSRKLSAYMSKRGLAEIEKKRTNLYQKYLPLISQFATELSGKTKEPDYKKLIKDLSTNVETQE